MVALVKRFQNAWTAFNNKPSQKNFPLPLVFHYQGAGQYNWSMIDYDAYAREGFSQNAVVYSALKYKIDAIAQSPMRVYEGNPFNAVLYEDLENPLAKLALRPNNFQSQIEFMQYCVMYLNLHGNCFVYVTGIAENDNRELAMYALRPDRVRIVPDKKNNSKTVIGYAYYPDGMSQEHAVPILPENMMHIKFPNPLDDLEGQGYGLSPLSAGAHTVDTDNLMTKFFANYFRNNGMQPGGVINLVGEADKEDINRLRAQFTEQYGGVDNWGRPIVLDDGATFSQMTSTLKDMVVDQIDLRNIRRSTVIFGVPARLIGLDEANSTYNNISEAKEDFWQRTMYAELLLFEEEFRHKLRLPDSDLFIRYDVSKIPAFAEDVNTQIQNYKDLVTNFVPPNVAAETVGLKIPEIEGGNVSYMPTGLIPVSQALNPPQPQLPGNVTPVTDGVSDTDMDDIDTPSEEDEQQARSLINPLHQKVQAWDFDTKQSIANNQDKIAESFEPEWEKATVKMFKKQRDHIMSLYGKYKNQSFKARKNLDVAGFEYSVRQYLFTTSLSDIASGMTPLLVELVVGARVGWGSALGMAVGESAFGAMFLSRESIEGEAWFAGYTLKFAKEVNQTTGEGIHAVIRDGLAEGFGTDKIGNKLELLFEQYMAGGTSPDDWAFMTERMPPYRTEMIARTETHGAMSYSNHSFFKRIGASKKEWLATADGRTRESHMQAWQRYSDGGAIGAIDMDEAFIVGGYDMMHPGDKSAPLKEMINCRCAELPVFPEE